MDFRRAGLFGQLQQRRRRLVRASWWTRSLRLRRSGSGLLQQRSDVRRSRGLRADLLRSRRRPGLLRSGSGRLRPDLLRSRRRPDLLRPGRLRADLLRSGPDLLHAVLWLLRQAEEVRSRLVRWFQEPLQEDEEEPLLLDVELLPRRADLLRSGRSQLLRSGRLCADLRRSRGLLPLITDDDLPGDDGEVCSTQTSRNSREREAESGGVPPLPRTRLTNRRDEHLEPA